jgi:putative SOS response-associated peptidase YedK
VLADGFYEWQKTGSKKKQPYRIRLRDGGPFAFAGLWETWNREGEPVQTCTILTTEPNELTRQVHDRMPVIVGRAHCGDWLDTARSSVPARGATHCVIEVTRKVRGLNAGENYFSQLLLALRQPGLVGDHGSFLARISAKMERKSQ